jgi:hypothetical protein
MYGSVTFAYLIDNQTVYTTLTYNNPYINKLQVDINLKKQIFELGVLSYFTGRLDEKQVPYNNLRIIKCVLM